MFFNTVATYLGIKPEPAYLALLFFGYSLLGYWLECIVLTVDKKELIINRGFVRHLPFCIIYGFGGIIGYAFLCPLANNWVLLFLVGAICATAFEYATAMLQLRIFGSFWWDYTDKPFNYKGILCLESTIGWGFVTLIIVKVLHSSMIAAIQQIPLTIAVPLAAVLASAYVLDFITSARVAVRQKQVQSAPANALEEETKA